MARLIRAHDWAATPLGAQEHWPGELRYAVSMMLASPQIASVVAGTGRVLLYNDAAAALYGDKHPGTLGRPVPETWPDAWAKVGCYYDRVFEGEGVHVPAQPLDLERPGAGQVFEAYLTPVRDAGGAVVAAHMTGFEVGARLRAEAALTRSGEREALLLELSDTIRTVSNPADIQQAAMRLLGERLGLSRAYYFAVERESGGWVHVIENAYQQDLDGPSMVGRHALANFGNEMFEGFARGEVIAAADVAALPSVTAEELNSYRALGVTAFINVPLLRNGEYSAGIGAHDTRPHVWTEGEIGFIREVAARTWTAVERARAEEAWRESEQKYHALFAASPVPFFVLSPEPPDFTFVAVNDAYLAVTMKTREGLIGRKVFDVFTDDPSRPDANGPDQLRATIARVLASGRPDVLPRTRYDIPRPRAASKNGGGWPSPLRCWTPPARSPRSSTRSATRPIYTLPKWPNRRIRLGKPSCWRSPTRCGHWPTPSTSRARRRACCASTSTWDGAITWS